MSQRTYLDQAREIDRLELIATHIRKNALENITKSKVGHPGGSLSIADILTILYFGRTYSEETGEWENIMRYDPKDPLWLNRDRFVLSKGHAAPALYATLAEAGFISKDVLKIYKKIDSPLEGHPAMYRVREDGSEHGIKGVDFSTGSLGHGLAAAAGMALHAKVYGYDYHVFAMLGDGDLQEGMIWEAALTIPNKGLNNVCAFVDYNRLQVDGCSDDINRLDPLDEKFMSFGWDVKVLNGHDYTAIIDALDTFKTTRDSHEKPLVIIAKTIKGKGATEIENRFEYHAVPLNLEQYERAAKECLLKIENIEKRLDAYDIGPVKLKALDKAQPAEIFGTLADVAKKNPVQEYTVKTPTRVGYGNAILRLGEYKKIFVLNADLAGACGSQPFADKYPENAPETIDRRSINVGVQEANMMTMGAALASCDKIPIVNSFGIFTTGRAFEMIRQDISYPKLNVKITGSHTGCALGEYGVSHQSIEDVGCMRVLPHLTIIEPSDALQADLMYEKVLEHDGPVYYRVGRNPSDLFYTKDNEFGIEPRTDFEIGKGYQVRDGKDITLVCSGTILIEALKVADMVEESVRVIDMPTVKPIDEDIIEEAAKETGYIVTVQDHFENCGLNEAVGKVLLMKQLHVKFNYIALAGFAESGSRDDLYEKYGLSANRIIEKLKLTRK
jgi:transketolase